MKSRLSVPPAARSALATLLTLAAALSYLPLVPNFPTPDSEAGWMLALNTAVAQGRVFGRDIIFTLGPYGSVATLQYNPATARMMFGGSAVVALALAGGLVALSEGWRSWRAAAAANVLLVLWARDALGYVLPLVALLACGTASLRPGWRTGSALPLLMAGLALFALVKESYAAGAGIALVCGLPLLHRRPAFAGLNAAVFGVALALFWRLAGQPLAALPGYFVAALPIVSGYGQAMGVPGPPADQVVCALAMLLVVVLLHRGFARQLGAAGGLLTLGATMILVLAFKGGFVRGDPNHNVIATDTLLLGAAVIATVVPRRLAAACWAAGVAAWMFAMVQLLPVTPMDLAMRLPQGWRNAVNAAVGLATYPAFLPLRFQASLADIRARYPLPAIAGSVDIYSYDQVLLLANRLDWDPRPVLQSYSAYTPGLAALDRAHLIGADAPDHVLFRVEPIDGRLPALEDGASWPVLMSRYQVTSLLFGGEMALLSRRAPPPAVAATILMAGRFATGSDIALPRTGGRLWAAVDLRPTLLGRLVDAAYKLPATTITLTCAGEAPLAFRYVPGMGQGFLISPLVRSTVDFVAVAGGAGGPCRPAAMRIDATWPLWPKKIAMRITAEGQGAPP